MMQAQCWICPKCYDDHSQEVECKKWLITVDAIQRREYHAWAPDSATAWETFSAIDACDRGDAEAKYWESETINDPEPVCSCGISMNFFMRCCHENKQESYKAEVAK